MKYVIDTHALIWFLEGNSRLSTKAKVILSQPDSQLIIPTTTLAEAVWIVERGRTSIPDPKDIISIVEADPRVVIYPFDQDVLHMTMRLSGIDEMHNRQIVATALIIGSKGEYVQLLTCEENLTASGLVATVW
ncbi:type II toxin-antitoxin system VapC family toxin [Umezakia ovalisporum]|jgi:PIN domain nuclease of toxin-antitoxin system|uniref:PIN domain-containing protein n=2 Tax=Umezakia ovalisporum TaxID=75695 RepID=A0AA43GYJ4_9CYAN|nr:PIN domain-containing protein [Umezakia ovalisporum]MBI1241808.1 PIN domain-containing protein [Nostoc sp. RI_552]MDH6056427.1 PIN domain-containing protein [Umezakia ovalisporum FSS-43]MDH6063865.1 PIN domain-containing protein [Umezakia ovalisporum FSS-62]MDH6066744.1 PIN domain-containing protein [Umezakia ovalisporum APH033B]MDH6072693.1 PIN domain-containing protein [Umezakia ovalisporum CobakiLakeA]